MLHKTFVVDSKNTFSKYNTYPPRTMILQWRMVLKTLKISELSLLQFETIQQ